MKEKKGKLEISQITQIKEMSSVALYINLSGLLYYRRG